MSVTVDQGLDLCIQIIQNIRIVKVQFTPHLFVVELLQTLVDLFEEDLGGDELLKVKGKFDLSLIIKRQTLTNQVVVDKFLAQLEAA